MRSVAPPMGPGCLSKAYDSTMLSRSVILLGHGKEPLVSVLAPLKLNERVVMSGCYAHNPAIRTSALASHGQTELRLVLGPDFAGGAALNGLRRSEPYRATNSQVIPLLAHALSAPQLELGGHERARGRDSFH